MKAKSILIFLLGVITGAGGMYLSFKPLNDKEVERRVNEVISGNKIEPKEELKEAVNPKEEPKEEVKEKKDDKDLARYYQALEKTDYTKAIVKDKVTTMTDAIDEKIDKMVDPVKKTAKKTKVPKKITQEEFDSTSEDERRTLYYYSDGVLADDEDEIYDPVETMGATNFKNFKSTYDTVYIFNYALDFMFEIIPSNSRYADIK